MFWKYIRMNIFAQYGYDKRPSEISDGLNTITGKRVKVYRRMNYYYKGFGNLIC